MLNSEDDHGEGEDKAANSDEELSCRAPSRTSCGTWKYSGEYERCAREGERFESARAVNALSDHGREMQEMKEKNATQKERTE
jgi:hypothetical protein